MPVVHQYVGTYMKTICSRYRIDVFPESFRFEIVDFVLLQVSWIRSKDLHILTSGRHTFSSDSRFESVHSSSSGDFWGLRIRGVHISDTGQYECQVNTDPKMSLAIYLNVQGIFTL